MQAMNNGFNIPTCVINDKNKRHLKEEENEYIDNICRKTRVHC